MKKLLNDTTRERVVQLALTLVVDDGTHCFQSNSFLADKNGMIKTAPTKERKHGTHNFCWPALEEYAAEHQTLEPSSSDFILTQNFCLQKPDDSIALFKEKGHFMRQVLELAKHTNGADGKRLIATAEANQLIAAIPLDRGRTR